MIFFPTLFCVRVPRTQRVLQTFVAACLLFGLSVPLKADTLRGALEAAYASNPDLQAGRAGLRAVDEDVAIAKSSARPSLSASVSGTVSDIEGINNNSASVGISASQMLFDGFQTKNRVLDAQTSVFIERANLAALEQNVFISVVQAYADVLLTGRIVAIRKKNLKFLQEQLASSKARLNAGEATRTDVAQSESSLAASKAQYEAALANYRASQAIYKQVIGHRPSKLKAMSVPSQYLPSDMNAALTIGMRQHPSLVAANLSIESTQYRVRATEGTLLPGVTLSGDLSHSDKNITTGRITARLAIPLYSSGERAARVRQVKEQLGQDEVQLDSVRRAVEQAIISAWVEYESAQASITANKSLISASNASLNGVIAERDVGQRTTLDVLNAQSRVLDGELALAQSQRNLVVSAYNILNQIGQLTHSDLNLQSEQYNPDVHYEAVKDKWFGLRTVTAQ